MKEQLINNKNDFPDYIFSIQYDCFFYLKNDFVRLNNSKEFFNFFSEFLRNINETTFYLSAIKGTIDPGRKVDISIHNEDTWDKTSIQGKVEKEELFYVYDEICIYGETDRWCIYGSATLEIMIIGMKKSLCSIYKHTLKPYRSMPFVEQSLTEYIDWLRQVYARNPKLEEVCNKIISNYSNTFKP
jgi:hypothetical protein